MPASLEQIVARLAVLEDVEEIRRLKARYLRACDLKHVEEVRDSFLPTGVRIAYQGFPVFTDRDAFVAVFQDMACQPGVFDIHHATNADVEVTGPDTARGRWSLNFRTILTGPRQVTRLAVEYDDIYRRHEGRWWIAESVSTITSLLTEEIAEDGSTKVLAFGAPPAA